MPERHDLYASGSSMPQMRKGLEMLRFLQPPGALKCYAGMAAIAQKERAGPKTSPVKVLGEDA
jgi:hypothetical protein